MRFLFYLSIFLCDRNEVERFSRDYEAVLSRRKQYDFKLFYVFPTFFTFEVRLTFVFVRVLTFQQPLFDKTT